MEWTHSSWLSTLLSLCLTAAPVRETGFGGFHALSIGQRRTPLVVRSRLLERRRLGADWSIVSDPVQRYLRMERNGHEWAKAAVREDLDSPAFYLFAMWWASVREIHEAFREERAALEETPQHLKVAHAASARNHQARAAEKTRIEAFAAEVGIN